MAKHNNIVIQNLSQIKDNKKILDNINLNIPINKVVCLVGPSACGKTSLLRVIAGLDNFNSGKIFFMSGYVHGTLDEYVGHGTGSARTTNPAAGF